MTLEGCCLFQVNWDFIVYLKIKNNTEGKANWDPLSQFILYSLVLQMRLDNGCVQIGGNMVDEVPVTWSLHFQ